METNSYLFLLRTLGEVWADLETNEMPPQAIREELNRLAKGEFGAFDVEKRRAEKRSPRVCPVCRELKNPDEYWPSERNNKWCKKCLSERGYFGLPDHQFSKSLDSRFKTWIVEACFPWIMSNS